MQAESTRTPCLGTEPMRKRCQGARTHKQTVAFTLYPGGNCVMGPGCMTQLLIAACIHTEAMSWSLDPRGSHVMEQGYTRKLWHGGLIRNVACESIRKPCMGPKPICKLFHWALVHKKPCHGAWIHKEAVSWSLNSQLRLVMEPGSMRKPCHGAWIYEKALSWSLDPWGCLVMEPETTRKLCQWAWIHMEALSWSLDPWGSLVTDNNITASCTQKSPLKLSVTGRMRGHKVLLPKVLPWDAI